MQPDVRMPWRRRFQGHLCPALEGDWVYAEKFEFAECRCVRRPRCWHCSDMQTFHRPDINIWLCRPCELDAYVQQRIARTVFPQPPSAGGRARSSSL